MFPQDEANRLRRWTDSPQRLANLLAFFALVSKQEQCAHVLLATSDGAFTAWLGSIASGTCGISCCVSLCTAGRHASFPAALDISAHADGGLNTQFFTTLYLGDLEEPDANKFFFEHALSRAPQAVAALRSDSAVWERIYQARSRPRLLLLAH